MYGRVDNSLACLLAKNPRVEALPKYCLRNLANAQIWYKDEDGLLEVVVASAYLPHESNFCLTAEVIVCFLKPVSFLIMMLKECKITPVAPNIGATLLQYYFVIFPIFANIPSTLLYMDAMWEQCCCNP